MMAQVHAWLRVVRRQTGAACKPIDSRPDTNWFAQTQVNQLPAILIGNTGGLHACSLPSACPRHPPCPLSIAAPLRRSTGCCYAQLFGSRSTCEADDAGPVFWPSIIIIILWTCQQCNADFDISTARRRFLPSPSRTYCSTILLQQRRLARNFSSSAIPILRLLIRTSFCITYSTALVYLEFLLFLQILFAINCAPGYVYQEQRIICNSTLRMA